MFTPTRITRRSRIALAAATLLLGAAGASASSHAAAPTTLTVAIGSDVSPPPAGVMFADEVRRLSGGSMAVAFQSQGETLTAESEHQAIRDVRSAASDMGWIPTRGWDTQGIKAFSALQAPFLISDYRLLREVLTGVTARRMSSGTTARGVRTLGLVPADLRRVLGVVHPFASPAEFSGSQIRVPAGSRATSMTLEALGATAREVASGSDLSAAMKDGSVDGAETSFGYILRNSYQLLAPYLAVNVVLFPRVDAISINEVVFKRLSTNQRAILTKAAAATTRKAFTGLAARDQEQLRLLCLSGLRTSLATAAQLSALRGAVEPVYAELRKHRATASYISQIRKMRKSLASAPSTRPPDNCSR